MRCEELRKGTADGRSEIACASRELTRVAAGNSVVERHPTTVLGKRRPCCTRPASAQDCHWGNRQTIRRTKVPDGRERGTAIALDGPV